MDGHTSLTSTNEEQLSQVVASQPVRAVICANEKVLQFYSKGIVSGSCSCSSHHAVTIVGYDSENGTDYWIVKNSWGRHWGMNGYMHIRCNSGNRAGLCGTNTLALYPIKPKPNPFHLPTLANVKCEIFWFCRAEHTCCCTKRVIICLHLICCGAGFPVCCGKHSVCCPAGYVCGVKKDCVLDNKNSNTTEWERVWFRNYVKYPYGDPECINL